MKYEIDEITTSLLEEVLNMAQRTVEIQYDGEMADSMQLVLAEVAERFNITASEVTDTGQVVPFNRGKPNLTIVDND